MLKWCIIYNNGNLETVKAFDTKEEALAKAESEWQYFTSYDRKRIEFYGVGICNVEYEAGCWQYAELENGIIDGDIYEIAKEF